VGHLWQGRFKSKIIEDERYFLQCGKYIELNPVRAGLVQAPDDYTYSSYGCYAVGRKDRAVDKQANRFYVELGGDEALRQNCYGNMMIEEVAIDELKKKAKSELKETEKVKLEAGKMLASSLRGARG